MYRPTPKDVLELFWCPRYLWFFRRFGVSPSERMRRGREAEVAAKRRLVSMLKAEVETVFVDVGWARGSVDAVVRRFGAAPVEVKLGARRDDLYRWQLYAEAYLLWGGWGWGCPAAMCTTRSSTS